MIVKERKVPLHLKKIEAIKRRIDSKHSKQPALAEERSKRLAGFRGEQSLDYYFSQLPKTNYYILHDVRIQRNHFFQLDTLILTTRFLLHLEVKNISGTLYFDRSFNQLIRNYDGKEQAFPDPLLQAKRQQKHLQSWVAENQFPAMPILPLIVISHPSTIIKSEVGGSMQKVIHAAALLDKIEQLEQKYQKEILQIKDLKKMSRLLIKQHTPSNPDILKTFQINEKEIKTGVHCPKCSFLPLEKSKKGWYCPACMDYDKHAHIEALKDYAYLMGLTITNQQAREFLQVDSRSIVTRLLKALNLQYTGNLKGRKYILPLEFYE
ncbi:nuclease-related domain-containing protein [Bacillus gobiensis]|uniref:NERD domain-containing protein n=1 Tax=Bacillus gobiensis TaxID=1441095 RepID=UPI003D1A3324